MKRTVPASVSQVVLLSKMLEAAAVECDKDAILRYVGRIGETLNKIMQEVQNEAAAK